MTLPFVAPKVTEAVGAVIYDWETYKLRIKADRIQPSGKAELWFFHVNGNGEELLHVADVNMMASTTMSGLVKRMQDNSSDAPWSEMLTYVTAKSVTISRRGEPVEELWTHEDIVPPQYLVNPFIIENYPNIIFGDPGTFKSNLSLILAQVVMLPWKDNELGFDAPEHTHHVLYLDWETDRNTIQWQLKSIQNGMGLSTTYINYRRCSQPLAADLQAIAEAIKKTEAQLIIIDSLGLACSGELSKEQSPLAFFTALRSLNITSLILAHNSKGGDTNKKSIYGSMFFHAQARNIWEIRKSQQPGSSEAGICLFNQKSPPFLGIQKPVAFKMTFGNQSTKVVPANPDDFQEFVEKMSVETQILLALRDGPMTPKELQENAGIESSNIHVSLARMAKKGQVVKLNNNRWGLAATDPQVDNN